MAHPPVVDRMYTNGSGDVRTVTDIGSQCSPNGKFDDWCSWVGATDSDAGFCSFGSFDTWLGERWNYDQDGMEAPRSPVATLESLNTMRSLQGHRLVTPKQYSSRLVQDTIPEQEMVDIEIAVHLGMKKADPVDELAEPAESAAEEGVPEIEAPEIGAPAIEALAIEAPEEKAPEIEATAIVEEAPPEAGGTTSEDPPAVEPLLEPLLKTAGPDDTRIADLIASSAKTVIAAVGTGDWDDALDAVHTAEEARQPRSRKTVLAAVSARLESL